MQYAELGSSGARVSRLCLGTNNFGGQLTEQTASTVIRKAADLGINFIDTANTYADGRSEEIVGKALREDRGRFVLATKVGYPTPGDTNPIDLSGANILAKVKDSLRRLGTDRIDLYYLHVFDPNTPLEESLGTMNGLVREGVVGQVGISNFTLDQLRAAVKVCEESGFAPPVAVQPKYNLLARDVERDILPYCLERRLGVAVYSPLAGGLLTGKYREGEEPPRGSRGAYRAAYLERINKLGKFQTVERLRSVAKDAGVSLVQLAIWWILRNPAVTAPIVGASGPQQVEENCRALELNLPERLRPSLDSITESWTHS